MAEINNVQLTEFCNSFLRPVADQFAHLDSIMAVVQAEYNARGLGTIISTAGSTNLITDGSAVDGRTRRVGGDVYNLITFITDFQAFMTQGRRDVVLGWQVNGVRP